MGLFGGGKGKERKALEHYLAAATVDGAEVDALKKACANAQSLLHDVLKSDNDSDHRFRALLGLEMLGITAEMLPAILDSLRDQDDFVQEAAGRILRNQPGHAQTVVPALIADYKEHAASRQVVLAVLAEFGPAACDAVPVVREGLMRPLEAQATAHCLARLGCDALGPLDKALVGILADGADPAHLRSLGAPLTAALEQFLLACVPWRLVDAIPAWRRVLESYAALCDRPADTLLPVLTELAQFSDWQLRGEVSAQFLDMSRAKIVASELVRRAGSVPG